MACDGPPGGARVFVWLTLEALGGWPGAVGVGAGSRAPSEVLPEPATHLRHLQAG